MREIFPSNLFRAELLKAIKYPEISYRKFCSEEYLGLDRKQNRVFVGLSLSNKTMIDHTRLSKFRSCLSFVQQINLLVYCLCMSSDTCPVAYRCCMILSGLRGRSCERYLGFSHLLTSGPIIGNYTLGGH